MTELEERWTILLTGVAGLCFVGMGLRSIFTGVLRLKRFETSLDQGWPMVVILLVLGTILVLGSAVAYNCKIER